MSYRTPGDPGKEPTMYSDKGYWWKLPAPLLAAMLLATVCYGLVLGFRSCAAPDSPPSMVCVESVEIIAESDTVRLCRSGRIATEMVPQTFGSNARLVVRCICGRDGGAP